MGSGKATLFIPKLDPSYAIWMGKIKGTEDYKNKYEVDEVKFTSTLTKLNEA